MGMRCLASTESIPWSLFIFIVALLSGVEFVSQYKSLFICGRTLGGAFQATIFWVVMGLAFALFVFVYLGIDACVGFLQGFALEYMISFDNLFVFHLVFTHYCTPEELLNRALYCGIAGMLLLRFFFLVVGCGFFSSGLYIVNLMFGSLLVWSGFRLASNINGEDSANPMNNRFISWVTMCLPVSDNYEPHGHFFMTVAEVEIDDTEETPSCEGKSVAICHSREVSGLLDHGEKEDVKANEDESEIQSQGDSSVRSMHHHLSRDSSFLELPRHTARLRRKASLLFLVVVALLGADLVFAVDSVTSKLASVNDILLNCLSSVFAMLGLRSLYFVMRSLVNMFPTLKYGVAIILALIGLKLMFTSYVSVSNGVSFTVIAGVCAASIASSYWLPHFQAASNQTDQHVQDVETLQASVLDGISADAASVPFSPESCTCKGSTGGANE